MQFSFLILGLLLATTGTQDTTGTQETTPAPGSTETETKTAAAKDEPAARRAPLEVSQRLDRIWDDFPVFAWFHEGPPPDTATFDALRERDLWACNVEAHEASTSQSLAQMLFYVGHLAGKGDLHLRAPVFDEARQEFLDHREGALPRRPVSLSDPALRKKLRDLVRKGVGKHRLNRPLAYSIDDEISATRGITPIDFSYDEKTLTAFRKWLTTKYHDIDDLNEIWGSAFEGLDDVVPHTTDEARKINQGRALSRLNFSDWSDHREFMGVELARVVEELTNLIGQLDPGVPAGFLGGQASSAFGGFDWWRLTQSCSFLEAYEYGLAPEMLHAFARPQTKIVSTLFLPEDRHDDDQLLVELWKRVARGDHGMVVWSTGRLFEPDSLQYSDAGKSLARRLSVMRRISEHLKSHRRQVPKVFLYVSQPSVRAAWMLDSWNDGDTWTERLTSFENENGLSIQVRESWGQLLSELSIPFGFIDSRDLLKVGGAELGAEVIVLSEAMALSDAEVHQLLRFIATGGLLIGDAHTALFDEHLRGRDSRALTALFGLERAGDPTIEDLGDWLAKEQSNRRESRYFGLRRGEPNIGEVAGEVVSRDIGWTRNIGDGLALYLNSDLRDYQHVSQKQSQYAQAFRTQIAEFLANETSLELSPHLPYDETCRRFRLHRFGKPEDGYLLLLPNETPIVEQRLEISLGKPVEVEDSLENVVLGHRRRLAVRIGPTRPKLFRVKPYRSVLEGLQPKKKAPKPPEKKTPPKKKPPRN